MKLLLSSIVTPLLFSILVTPALAVEAPRIIPQRQEIRRPMDEVFASLKKYFSDSSLSNFQLVSADKATHTLVARQSGVGEETWRRWAFCETGPVQMIYKLEDGTVVVTVELEKSTSHSTFASVSADFEGTYQLGSNTNKVACTSKFVLEDNIVAVADAGAGK
jgi:hypothetical protein